MSKEQNNQEKNKALHIADVMPRIYEMKLHETEEVSEYLQIIRVAGGWIYNFKKGSEIFVPFDNEFMPS